MIKLIIWDLDGVLYSSKNFHFEALNKALVDFNEQPINYQEHISIFDGKPTKEKLKIRKIPEYKHDDINKRKQIYTSQLLEEFIKPDIKFVNLFKKLKEDKYFIAIASNSIRYTIQLVSFKMGIMKYVDYILSNQDVEQSKPHSEMYLKCMLYFKVNPKETLIIEDSYVGRQGAFNSGAFLCAVKNPEEVTYELIMNNINYYKEKKMKWKSNSLNIVIPLAGRGSRFKDAGYTFPKPLIMINNKPMVEVVIKNLNMDGNYIFIVRKEHVEQFNILTLLNLIVPGCTVITIDNVTEGAACTVLKAKNLIDNNNQLIVINSDQFMVWDSSDFMYQMQPDCVDGGIVLFESTHPKWSFVNINSTGWIDKVVEKEPISTSATTGCYMWKRGSDCVRGIESMIKKNIRTKNEFYLAPSFNELILEGKKIKPYHIKEMYGLGIPEDLDEFLRQSSKYEI